MFTRFEACALQRARRWVEQAFHEADLLISMSSCNLHRIAIAEAFSGLDKQKRRCTKTEVTTIYDGSNYKTVQEPETGVLRLR